MADQNLTQQQATPGATPGAPEIAKPGLTTIEDAAALFGTAIQTSNAPGAPSDQGVEMAKEAFTEMVEKLSPKPEATEKPVEEKPDTSVPPGLQAPVAVDVPVLQNSPAASTSVIAIAAFISVFLVPLLGLILGYLAKKDIAQSSGDKSGKGLAKASIVLGWIFVSFGVLFSLLVIAAALSKQ